VLFRSASFFGEASDARAVGNVEHLDVEERLLGLEGVKGCSVAVDRPDGGPGCGEGQGGCAADTLPGAGDDRNLAGESFAQLLSLSFYP
jgi:hypothetical protein